MKARIVSWQYRLILLSLCITSLLNASAYDVVQDGIRYNYNNGEMEVAGYTGVITDVIIPSQIEYNGEIYPVTSIGSYAFYGCYKLTSIVIPNTITTIEKGAFDWCQELKELIIEDGTDTLSLGNYVNPNSGSLDKRKGLFADCPLEYVRIGRALSYDEKPFVDKQTVTSVVLSGSVNSSGLFSGCTGLQSVEIIPNSVTTIGDHAFDGCTGLQSVIIPNSVTTIGDHAFDGCTGLQSVIIPNSVTTIESGAFLRCTNLISITLPNSITHIGSFAFHSCSSLESISIPESVTEIGSYAFNECVGLTSISIPTTVKSIDAYAFSECTNLKELTIQPGTEELRLGDTTCCGVFDDCPLESVYLGRNLSHSHSPFENCETLADVEMSNTVTTIGNEAFYGCSGLLSFAIPTSVTSIGESAFAGCTGLGSITIPNAVTSIEESAFAGCTGLGSITIPNAVTSIGDSAFTGCTGLSSITIPNAVTSIGDSAFAGCTGLGSITIPNAVTSLGKAAFKDCSGITYFSIGKLLRTIGEEAFYGCNPERVETFSYNIEGIESSGLSKNVAITLKSDSDFAGIGNTTLTYFNRLILKDKNNKEYGLAISPWNLNFANCLHSENDKYILPLEECHIRYSNDNQYIVFRAQDITKVAASETGFTFIPSPYHSRNIFSVYGDADDASLSKTIHLDQAGTLFDKLDLKNIEKIQTLILSGYINGTDVMTINRMTALKYLDITDAMIVEGGMTYRDNLKTADNVVGERFFNDINLEVLHLPNTAYEFENFAFAETSLKFVTIPPSVRSMGSHVFAFCPSLTTLTIPGSVTSIGNEAFVGTPLKELIFEDGEEELTFGSDCFGYSGLWEYIYLKTLYLGRNIRYSGDSPFSLPSLTDVTISDSVTSISAKEFAFTGISHLTLPESITTIGYSAFEWCSELESVVIPKSVTSIGSGAFKSCRRLSSVSVPENLETIEDDVFNRCIALSSFTIPETVTSIGRSAFENCSNLTSIQMPQSVLTIGDRAFKGCSSLAEANIPDSITSIGEYAFYNTSITEVVLPESVQKVGDYAFGGNTGISKVVSLNSIPPAIYTNTFDSEVEASIPLHVCKGALVYYWLDPVWKEFLNISDDVFRLLALPEARYGDDDIDLSQYAPEGVAFTYQSSNEDVVKINGSSMQIVGAGEATIASVLADEGSTAELVGQMRQVFVDKADLMITVDEIVIHEGESVPDFKYLAEGLQYDDTLDDIDILPQPIHNVNENSPIGEYAVSFTDGSDRNYRIATKPSKITVSLKTGVKDNISDAAGQDIEVYDLKGLLIYRGPRRDAVLQKGIYIVRQGAETRKITVR